MKGGRWMIRSTGTEGGRAKGKDRLKRMLLMVLLSMIAFSLLPSGTGDAAPLLKMGSRDGYVYDLQYRLHELGLYNATQDGLFGSLTLQGVMALQKRYGLKPDGIVGPKTWQVLYAHTYTAREIDLLVRVVSAEAQGEPYEGQVAVASVILNRLKSPLFPSTIEGIIFEKGAFESVQNGMIWKEPAQSAYQAVYAAIRGWDPTGGALFFYNPKTAASKWMTTRTVIARIGAHVFTI